MEGFNKARAERVGDLLRRYMWARARCVGGEAPALQLSELAGRLQWGPCEFDGVRVELNLEPPIVWDSEHPAFYHAIVESDHSAMPGIEALDDWRKYVYFNGPMPTQRGVKFPLATRTSVRQHSERIDVA